MVRVVVVDRFYKAKAAPFRRGRGTRPDPRSLLLNYCVSRPIPTWHTD